MAFAIQPVKSPWLEQSLGVEEGKLQPGTAPEATPERLLLALSERRCVQYAQQCKLVSNQSSVVAEHLRQLVAKEEEAHQERLANDAWIHRLDMTQLVVKSMTTVGSIVGAISLAGTNPLLATWMGVSGGATLVHSIMEQTGAYESLTRWWMGSDAHFEEVSWWTTQLQSSANIVLTFNMLAQIWVGGMQLCGKFWNILVDQKSVYSTSFIPSVYAALIMGRIPLENEKHDISNKLLLNRADQTNRKTQSQILSDRFQNTAQTHVGFFKSIMRALLALWDRSEKLCET